MESSEINGSKITATQSENDNRLLLLHPQDNVLVLICSIASNETYWVGGKQFRTNMALGIGHKIARRDIAAEGKILKYGIPIGSATAAIHMGDHVHIHNLKSDYLPTFTLEKGHLYEHSAH